MYNIKRNTFDALIKLCPKQRSVWDMSKNCRVALQWSSDKLVGINYDIVNIF